MIRINLLFVLMIGSICNAQIIDFPDPVFKAKLLEADVTNNIAQDASNANIKIDVNSNGEIEQSEALLVYRLFYTSTPPFRPGLAEPSRSTDDEPITDVTGLYYFSNLRRLDLSNNQIEEIDLTGLASLQTFICKNSNVQTMDISGSPALAYLNCSENALTELALAGHPLLQTLVCNDNQLTQLFTSGLTSLQYFACHNNSLTAIHFGYNPNLTFVFCYSNLLTQINLDGTSAVVLHCNDNPNLTTIKVKNNIDSPFTYDEFPMPPINAFEFGNLPLLETVCCDSAEVAVMEQVLASQPTVGITTDCLPPAVINFPDIEFKNALVTTNCANFEGDLGYDDDADLNDDGEIDVEEALLIQSLSIGAANVTNLDGLQYFENLFGFYIGGNPLTHFDGYGLDNLINLGFRDNSMISVNLSGLILLETLEVINEPLVEVDFSANPSLFFVRFWTSPITTLNFCGTGLQYFDGFDLSDLTYFSSKNGIITTDGLWPNTPPPLSPIQLYDCPSLQTVCYDEGEYGFINWGDAIPGTTYVTDCPSDCSILQTKTQTKENFAIYPNPASTVLNIKSEVKIDAVEISNHLGQTVLKTNANLIDVSGLASGVYFVKAHLGKTHTTHKFIKL